eukprot:6214681-Pleurochrysis_carterae.AAC.9
MVVSAISAAAAAATAAAVSGGCSHHGISIAYAHFRRPGGLPSPMPAPYHQRSHMGRADSCALSRLVPTTMKMPSAPNEEQVDLQLGGKISQTPRTPEPREAGILPIVALLLVPVSWGTYGVTIKQLYSVSAPPPELLFAVLNYITSSAALALASSVFQAIRSGTGDSGIDDTDGAGDSTIAEVGGTAEPPENFSVLPTSLAFMDSALPGLRQGAELGGYLFIGSLVQIFGMRYTTASRGAFIVQLTTVMVPLLDALISRKMPRLLVIGACVLAFGGVALLVSTDLGAGVTDSTPVGDGLIGIAAVFYSLHVVRLSALANRVSPIALARAKEISRLLYALVCLIAGVVLFPGQAESLWRFVQSFKDDAQGVMLALGIIVWSGVVTTAYPTWAQSYGQRSVSAAAANVIYTTQPLWSALFARLVLGETLGERGAMGAAAIMSALMLVAADSFSERESTKSKATDTSSATKEL